MLLRQGPFFVTTRIALQGHILFFQIKGGQLNGTNVLLQTMRWNNRMVRCPRGWARVMSYDWWYLTQATPVAEEALPITSNRRPYAGDQRDCCGRPSPTIYLSTSCFSWLSARFCLYNTSCVWRHSSSYYTAALIKPWLLVGRQIALHLLRRIIWDVLIGRRFSKGLLNALDLS